MKYVNELDTDSINLVIDATSGFNAYIIEDILNSKIDDIQDFLTNNHLKYDTITHNITVNTFSKDQSKAYNQICRLLKNRSLSITQRQLTTKLKHDLQRSIKKHKQFRQ